MGRWNSSPHPISDIRDWSEAGKLEIRPDFQRREVWSIQAKIMLMDTILKQIPMPKIFLSNTVRDGSTYRKVIDGQQRITAILGFMRDSFRLDEPYLGECRGLLFSELEPEVQNEFLSYTIDFNEAYNLSDEEVREVYARVNKYTIALNKQELRRADFPGDFLDTAEALAGDPYFDEIKIFNAANVRRYHDVEYISELLAAMIGGIQDKKSRLDNFYLDYSSWNEEHKQKTIKLFNQVLEEINELFDPAHDFDITKTRFKQKADFYSLFLTIHEFIVSGYTIKSNNKGPLIEDLKIINLHIRPASLIDVCKQYAVKCVSQANSAASRRWRHNFLKTIMYPTYTGTMPEGEGVRMLYRLREDLDADLEATMFGCPPPVFYCPVCDEEIDERFRDCLLSWRIEQEPKQLESALWVHKDCHNEDDGLVVMAREDNLREDGELSLDQEDGEDSEQPDLF